MKNDQYVRQAQYKKGFANLILIGVVVVLLVLAGWYFGFRESPTKAPPINQKITTQPTTAISNDTSESEIMSSLKTDWQSVQATITFRPSHPGTTVWGSPESVQFVGNNDLLIRFEDGYNSNMAVLNFSDSQFKILETFKNQGEFTLLDWQNLVKKYGDSFYSIGTYTISLLRNNEIVSFQDLTKVPENIFVKNYWESGSTKIVACKQDENAVPVIYSLSSSVASIGDTIKIHGCNLRGFEGDKTIIIKNTEGVTGILYGGNDADSENAQITLVSPLCQTDNSYSGLPCDKWLTLTPGIYKIYTVPWGKKSNEVNITIK